MVIKDKKGKASKLVLSVMTGVVLLTGASLYAPESYNFLSPTVAHAEEVEGEWEYSLDSAKQPWLVKYLGTDSVVVTPTELGGKQVIAMRSGVFSGQTLDKVTISDGISSLQLRGFENTTIRRLELPGTLRNVRGSAFSGTDVNIKELYVPSTVGYLAKGAFSGNSNIEKIIVEGPNVNIQDGVFDPKLVPNLKVIAPNPSKAKDYADANGFSFTEYDPDYVDNGGSSDIEQGDTSAETDLDMNLVGGYLTLKASPVQTFGDIFLEKDVKKYNTSFNTPFNVKDLRGTGEGWRLDVSSTQFEILSPDSNYKLPVGSLTIDPLEDIIDKGNAETILPVKGYTSNNVLDDGTFTVAHAKEGTGLGDFQLEFPEDAISVVIDPTKAKIDPKNFPDGKTPYKAVVSWDLVDAP